MTARAQRTCYDLIVKSTIKCHLALYLPPEDSTIEYGNHDEQFTSHYRQVCSQSDNGGPRAAIGVEIPTFYWHHQTLVSHLTTCHLLYITE